MELGWLEDFLALADHGNFNRAAAARSLTQPAFSRRIRALESWMGAPLFDRSTHRVELTEAGRVFQPLAADLVRRIAVSRDQVRETAGTAAATLRFAATHALSLTFFPGWLRHLAPAGQACAIHLMSDTMRACEQALLQGRVQFLLRHHHPAMPDGLPSQQFRSRTVGQDVLLPVSRPDAQGQPRYALPGSAAPPLPLLGYSDQSALGWVVKAACAACEPPPQLETLMTADLATALLAMARDGRGLAWLPASLITEDLAADTLVRAGGPVWDAGIEIRLFRPRARQAPAAEAFWSALGPEAP